MSAEVNRVALRLGVVLPSEGSGDLENKLEALAAHFRTRGWMGLEVTPLESYKALAACVRAGECDVAWLPPVVYAWIAEGVTALGSIAREDASSYASALVVREDSSIRSLADIRGVRAAWVDPWSAAGYVFPRLELTRRGLLSPATFTSETFYGSHREALLAVARGDSDIAATYARSRDGAAAATGAWTDLTEASFRVVDTIGPIPTDVLAVRRNLAPREHEAAIAAFRAAREDRDARALLRDVFGGEELREDVGEGHDKMRRAYERAIADGVFD